jgi:AcrR family transcriptional regulator
MRTDKDVAFSLRKEGKSYNEIASALNVAKSTLSNWFKGQDFSADIKRSITDRAIKTNSTRLLALNKARGDLLQAHYEQGLLEAKDELVKNINNPLFVNGIATYWGEGDKLHKNHIRITNTDPQMLRLFVEFLKEFGHFTTNDMRLALFLYQDLDVEDCKAYWIKHTKITKLHKPMVLPGRDKRRRLAYGTATVVVMNTYFKRKLLYWIDQFPKIVLNTVPSREVRDTRP